MSALDQPARNHVLERFGVEPTGVTALGGHGGFSGAALWRVEAAAAAYCLKAWPAAVGAEQVRHAHWLMRQGRVAGLEYVPAPHDSAEGGGCVSADGRVWDLTTWQPGRADFHTHPTAARITAACSALAGLHRAWKPPKAVPGPLPAVRRRLAAADHWQGLVRGGWQPDFAATGHDALAAWAERAWHVLHYAVRRIPMLLHCWADARLPVQPCLCDIWHDHVLYTGDEVSGVVDFGSAKTDHAAVDLARLLGSLVEDDVALREAGLDAYDREVGLGGEERALVDVLDRTGAVLGLATWLLWLYDEKRPFTDLDRVAARVAGLVRRVEAW